MRDNGGFAAVDFGSEQGANRAAARPFRASGYSWSAALALSRATAFVAGAIAGDMTNGIGALALLAVGLAGRAAGH